MLRSKTFGSDIIQHQIPKTISKQFTMEKVMQLKRQLTTLGAEHHHHPSDSSLLCKRHYDLAFSTSSFVGTVKSNRWMQDLLSKIGNTQITKLKIPATHDSATYNVSSSQEYSSDLQSDPSMTLIPQMIQIFTSYGLNTQRIKQFVAPWFKNQECTIYQQLNQGIRHLDLRVCKMSGVSSSELKFVACHGLASVTIANVLRQVKQFLNDNKKEVVTLDFNHLYGFSTQNDHLEFLNMSRSILGSELMINPAHFSTNSTLNQILSSPQRVFFYYSHSTTVINYANAYNLFPSWRIDTRWANKQNMNLLKSEIIAELNSRTNFQYKFVSQILMTPDLNMMVNGLFESPKSVKELALMNYQAIPSWIASILPSSQLNIVNTDYYHLFGEHFISSIIRKNL
ncbi:predicted protein [Naegleria gruberi]|uniref:Predicted protein n=1 Tax=Naegleria gruberi TaxID=5762 RepID=D2VC78_NAEGR|nr:uncharacterized protein NAEGRDRAFT_48365 [Naegleria gruberi]EFC45701.1 predicted protein [Naegleria gruberi]|eukprot:XP_002678445.1 predicted protein [Naegleria gruberi strain NEG-M]